MVDKVFKFYVGQTVYIKGSLYGDYALTGVVVDQIYLNPNFIYYHVNVTGGEEKGYFSPVLFRDYQLAEITSENEAEW